LRRTKAVASGGPFLGRARSFISLFSNDLRSPPPIVRKLRHVLIRKDYFFAVNPAFCSGSLFRDCRINLPLSFPFFQFSPPRLDRCPRREGVRQTGTQASGQIPGFWLPPPPFGLFPRSFPFTVIPNASEALSFSYLTRHHRVVPVFGTPLPFSSPLRPPISSPPWISAGFYPPTE